MAHAFRYLIVLLVAMAGISARGQQGGAAGQAQAVRFTVFSARPLKDVAFAVRPGEVPQSAAFYPTARSPRYDYRGPMPLRFVDPESGTVVAEAVIPPGIRDALLLFSPIAPERASAGSSLRYQIAVLDDGLARHGSGGLAIINLSGLELSGTVGKQAVTLRAGLNPTLSMGRSAAISLRSVTKGRSYQSYAHTVKLAPKERALLIFFPPFSQGSVEVQSRLLIDLPPARD